MKKTILSLVATAITLCAFADGVIQNNSVQSGITTFTFATALIQTNTFPVPYTTLPVVTVYSTATNDTPFTVSSVTLSNFILTVTAPAAGTTNCSVIWNSYAGYPRIQSGTLAANDALLNTNTFTVPYAATPQVFIQNTVFGSTTNTIAPTVITTTTTNFIVQFTAGTTNQSIGWMSIGTAYAPGVKEATQ
jgi:hypothetical protein